MATQNVGRVVQVIGPVVDVEFDGTVPAIYNAVRIQDDGTGGGVPIDVVTEVEQHLGENRVRCVAMLPTDGMVRGMKAVDTGAPIMVPVGPATLGRVLNVIGAPVDEMGPVNLVAIEEYEETEQRYQFLTQQHEDLIQAKAQLLEVITRINTQTREMFKQTFEQIRDNFRAMFTEVFGGGKADLILVDENDVLESGIDIVASPPGKKLQNVLLLSGGEKALTAVALLMAIFRYQPSPFCILDEVDAPLDEANIARLTALLREMSSQTQFILITHSKKTMETAQALYGVTMQEPGISRLVSVRFQPAEERVAVAV